MEKNAEPSHDIQQKFSKTLFQLVANEASDAIQDLQKKYPEICKAVREHVPAEVVVKIVLDTIPKGITALEMARILKDLGFDVFEIARAIRDGYSDTTAKEMVGILLDPEVCPDTTRDEMIKALRGARYNYYDNVNAVTPYFPEMRLIQCKGGAVSNIFADPSEDPNVSVFVFNPVNPTYCPEHADLSGEKHKCDRSEVEAMLKPGSLCVLNPDDKIGFVRYKHWSNAIYYQVYRYPDAKSLLIQVKCLLSYAIGREFLESEDTGEIFCKS